MFLLGRRTDMSALRFPAVVAGAGLAVGALAVWAAGPRTEPAGSGAPKALKVITMNTQAYPVGGKAIDKRSISITADEDMHIVGVEHFCGVQKGIWSDNGHVLSLKAENPWVKWEKDGTGMEPTGERGYFGYCGRDYYTEVGGIGDVEQFEMFPAGTHFFVPAGAKIYLHCYAANFGSEQTAMFHHAVRLLHW
jgi:hypothetical protein